METPGRHVEPVAFSTAAASALERHRVLPAAASTASLFLWAGEHRQPFQLLVCSSIVAYIRKHFSDHELARSLVPRKIFRFASGEVAIETLIGSLGGGIRSLDQLMEDVEPRQLRLPMRIGQHIGLTARSLSFNVDPSFGEGWTGSSCTTCTTCSIP